MLHLLLESSAGFQFTTVKDKIKIQQIFSELKDSDFSAIDALKYAFDKKILKQSESCSEFMKYREHFLEKITEDAKYQEFKIQYLDGQNTYAKIAKIRDDLVSEEFSEFERMFKRELFYIELFSEKLKFSEITNYYNFLGKKTEYITMHKTKGAGLENIIVVLDEYFWSDYKFRTVFDPDYKELDKNFRNLKLFYVSCSRAIKNLVCVNLVVDEEEEAFLKMTKHCEEIFV